MNSKKSIARILITAICILMPCVARADIYQDNNIPDEIKEKIEKIVDEPSHLDGIDDFKRKPRQKRIKDNIDWYKKYDKVNTQYNKYCLDIENFGNPDDFIDFRTGFKRQEKSKRSKAKFCVDNKLALYSAAHEKYEELTAPIYFRFKGEKLLDFKYAKIKDCSKTRSALKKLPDGKYFIKPQYGKQGDGAILMVKNGGKLSFTHVSKGKIDLKKFLELTKNSVYFLQAYIEQHKALKALNPSSLNTIRIITTKFNDEPQILCAGLRMGKNSKTIVDNASQGGCFVGIGRKSGKLQKYAFSKTGRAMKEHPESKIKFENYQIPFWKDCVAAVKKLHMLCPGYTSVGWDIAITPKGPVLVEGNSGWGGYIPNLTCRGIRKRWEHNKKI